MRDDPLEEREPAVELSYHNVTVYSNGSFSRSPYSQPLLPACPSPASPLHDVASKDITLNPSLSTWARLYLPPCSSPHQKLPLLLYFHGGGFLNFSTAFPMYHSFLCRLAARSRTLIISVDYRLAPEHPLPAAYDDCFEALTWLTHQQSSCTDPWLASHADFSRCFLGGDSAGANIVHHVAMGAVGCCTWREESRVDLGLISLQGMIVIHPFFTCGVMTTLSATEAAIWKHSGVSDKVHAFAHPLGPALQSAPLPRALVAVAGNDGLYKRGIAYYEGLVEAGKTARLFITEGEGHVFHLFTPSSENVLPFLDELSSFIHEC